MSKPIQLDLVKKYTRSGHTKWARQKIKTEISHQQRIGAQNLKELVFAVLKVLSHIAIKFFVL